MAARHNMLREQRQNTQFYWKKFERAGKIAGVVISLLSLGGILFAAGSKIQSFIDDLAHLHQRVEAHEERLQQNEANDSRRAEEVSYLKGKLEQKEDSAPELRGSEPREESLPRRVPARPRRTTSLPPAPAPVESKALHIEDKLYTTIFYYYRQALLQQPHLAGELTVRCQVDQTGSLDASEVVATAPALTELARRRWKSPQQVTGLESGGFRKTYFLSPQGF
jgi:hypothetical protein